MFAAQTVADTNLKAASHEVRVRVDHVACQISGDHAYLGEWFSKKRTSFTLLNEQRSLMCGHGAEFGINGLHGYEYRGRLCGQSPPEPAVLLTGAIVYSVIRRGGAVDCWRFRCDRCGRGGAAERVWTLGNWKTRGLFQQ